MFAAATAWLEAHAEQVNAVNVFPVPDGDTGTNMLLTMRSTMRDAEGCEDEGVGAMLAAMSHGALMGARGNSGVILSQIISGLARHVGTATSLDASLLAEGLQSASDAAYKAVASPTEGTILTVIREVAEAVTKRASNGSVAVGAALETAVETAKESVERTPSLLPVLKEAGVVDAGGLGLLILLEGMLRQLQGKTEGDLSAEVSSGEIGAEWLSMTEERHSVEGSPYGYCTEVLIGGEDIEIGQVRPKVEALGDSAMVVGGGNLVRVHVHTDDPGAVLTLGTGVGQLVQVKVDNISEQAERFVQMHGPRSADQGVEAPAPRTLSCVAVASGEGMAKVFRSVDGTRVVKGGPTMNPSTQEIVDAIEACGTDDVVVLPNDKNIIMAAEQAAGMSKKRVRVVQSRSVPQGIAAVLAVNQEDDIEENLRAMREAIALVRTVEITKAVRATTVGGVDVAEGQAIAIVDDELKLAADSTDEVVLQALEGVAAEETSLITLYYGADVDEDAAQRLSEAILEKLPEHEIEIVFGGQPHYDYIISVE